MKKKIHLPESIREEIVTNLRKDKQACIHKVGKIHIKNVENKLFGKVKVLHFRPSRILKKDISG